MNHRRWLAIAEYVSLAGSVVGSVIAAMSGQVIYASAPVTVSLLLNLASRRRLEHLSPQDGISTQVELALTSIQTAKEEYAQELRTLIDRLEHQVQNPGSAQELTPVDSAIEQLRSQLQRLEESVKPMKAQLDALSQEFKARPELEHIASLTSVIVALQQCIDSLPNRAGEQTLKNTQMADIEEQVLQAIARIPALVDAAVGLRLDDIDPEDKSTL